MKRKIHSDGSIGYEYERGDWVYVPEEIPSKGALDIGVRKGSRGAVCIVGKHRFDRMLIRYEDHAERFFCNFHASHYEIRPCPWQQTTPLL